MTIKPYLLFLSFVCVINLAACGGGTSSGQTIFVDDTTGDDGGAGGDNPGDGGDGDGGDDGDDGPQLGDNIEPNILDPVFDTATPDVVQTTPPYAPDPLVFDRELREFELIGSSDGELLLLSWSDANAFQYRVLYGIQGERPTEQFTNATVFNSPNDIPLGVYEAVIEAYDEVGNSVFSQTVVVPVGVPLPTPSPEGV